MLKYVARRLAYAVLTFFGITIVVFALVHSVPGDPIDFILGSKNVRNEEARVKAGQENSNSGYIIQPADASSISRPGMLGIPQGGTPYLKDAPYRLAVVQRQRLGHYAARQMPQANTRQPANPSPELRFRVGLEVQSPTSKVQSRRPT